MLYPSSSDRRAFLLVLFVYYKLYLTNPERLRHLIAACRMLKGRRARPPSTSARSTSAGLYVNRKRQSFVTLPADGKKSLDRSLFRPLNTSSSVPKLRGVD